MFKPAPKQELRILHLSDIQKTKDPLAAPWSGKVVMVTKWYLSWVHQGMDVNTGEFLWAPVWRAKILELPDRWFNENQLLRIMYHE